MIRLLLALLTLAAIAPASAQAWPDRPVKFVMSAPAGSSIDVLGRLIADKLKECKLSEAQSEYVLKELAAAGVPAQAAASDEVPAKGRFLQLRIESAMAAGNAFVGHQKYVSTSAHLFENGKEIAQTTLSRDSMGGAFGGYKSSCSVLRRCVVTLGKDGIFFETEDGSHRILPTEARAVFDVTGAGDTVVAALTYLRACGVPLEESLRLANHAAGITVGKLGTWAPSR